MVTMQIDGRSTLGQTNRRALPVNHDAASLTPETLMHDAEQWPPTHVAIGELGYCVHEKVMIVGLILIGEQMHLGLLDLGEHAFVIAKVSRTIHELVSSLNF